MRDPARITEILASLQAVWQQSPDMRLGQLVMSAAARGNHLSNDIFYVEDDVVLNGLKQMNGEEDDST